MLAFAQTPPISQYCLASSAKWLAIANMRSCACGHEHVPIAVLAQATV